MKRELVYFVLDFVEVSSETRFIEPVSYRFESKQLYYPLRTSNTFGGTGTIELIVIAPTTLCAPGNEPMDAYSGALYRERHPEAQRPTMRPLCLNLPVKASTSALLKREDLQGLVPDAGDFFKSRRAFVQVVKYAGKYSFKDDIFVDAGGGKPEALGGIDEDPNDPFAGLPPVVKSAVDPTAASRSSSRRTAASTASRRCSAGPPSSSPTSRRCARPT